MLARPQPPGCYNPCMSPRPRLGTVIGGYRIVDFIDQGGMGTVYLAEHQILERTVAFKILSDELATDESFRARFLRESRLAVRLSKHPNVIQIYDAGEVDGLLYIAMYYVEGRTLQELLREEQRLTPERTVAILRQVAGALDAAHELGLVHRDVKPGNILIEFESDGREQVFLGDFGLVREMSSRTRLTRTGYTLATLEYAPPEQLEPDLLKGESIDGRADVYSLGCVLFECLSGTPPFGDKDTDGALIAAHLIEPPPRITDRRPEVPDALNAVIARAMAKPRSERYTTCGEMIMEAAGTLQPAEPVARTTPVPVLPPAPHRKAEAERPRTPAAPAPVPHPGGTVRGPEPEPVRPIPQPPARVLPNVSRRAMVGAILAVLSTVLPWAGDGVLGFGPFAQTAFGFSLSALWSRTSTGPVRIGYLLVILGAAGVVLSLRRAKPAFLRLLGVLIVAVAVLFWMQALPALKDLVGSTGRAIRDIGLGDYVALVGGILMLTAKPGQAPPSAGG
jgi:serine/threonine protein kinase